MSNLLRVRAVMERSEWRSVSKPEVCWQWAALKHTPLPGLSCDSLLFLLVCPSSSHAASVIYPLISSGQSAIPNDEMNHIVYCQSALIILVSAKMTEHCSGSQTKEDTSKLQWTSDLSVNYINSK